MSTGGGDTTTSNIAEPWGGLKPYLTSYYGGATDWYNNQAPQQYPGQRVAGLNEQQLAALGQQEGMAQNVLPGQINATQGAFFQNLNPMTNPMMGQVQGMMGSANTALGGILGQPYQPTSVQQPQMPSQLAPFQPGNYTPPETTAPQPVEGRPQINPDFSGGGGGGGGGFNFPDYPIGTGPPTEDAQDDFWPFSGGMMSGQMVPPGQTYGDLGDMPQTTGGDPSSPTDPGAIVPPPDTGPGVPINPPQQTPASIPSGGYQAPQIGFNAPGVQLGQAPQINFNPQSPQAGFNPQSPRIGFNPQTQQINAQQFTPQVDSTLGAPSPTDSLSQMMSGTPNMDVWEPVMDAASRGTIEQFNREVLPGITEQEIGSGQWGSSRADIARGIAAGDVGQAIADNRAQLGQQAASEALQQQGQGTNIAAQLRQAGGQLGLGAAELGGQLGTSQAQLGQSTQELGANLSTQQAQLGMDTQQLSAGLAQGDQQAQLQTNEMLSRVQDSNARMQLEQMLNQGQFDQATQQLNAQLSMEQAGLGMQANQLTEQQRASMAGERINAADIQMGASQDMYGNMMNNYSRQLGLAPSITEMGMMPSTVMSQVGGAYQDQSQRYIDDAVQQWNYEQQLPLNMLSQYRDLLNAPGSNIQSSFTSGPEPNPTAAGLGGAASGAGMGYMYTGNPWGALAGGLIGGGLGYFGSQ